jgi:pimeloyl-ACP methyl ester carboxylesterase
MDTRIGLGYGPVAGVAFDAREESTTMSDPSSAAGPVRSAPCQVCGASPHPGDRYCTSCAARLPLISSPARRPVDRFIVGIALGCVVAFAVMVIIIGQLAPGDAAADATILPQPPSSASAAPPASAAPGLGTAFGSSRSAEVMRCGAAELECERLLVPVDHAFAASVAEMEVVFGRHEADPDRRTGTLVVATGGPGSSGIELASEYLSMFPDIVLDRYDIVFFEQRGVGRSAGVDCSDADLGVPGWVGTVDEEINSAIRRATKFVEACLDEAGIDAPADLDRYATHQAAADLDAYLDYIGAGQVVLYGESYGSQLVQVYAALRPERVSGLILDGVVDPALDPIEASVQQAAAFSEVLDRVFAACVEDQSCAEDFGATSAAAAWDALAEELGTAPIAVAMPTRDGGSIDVGLTRDAFTRTTGTLLYDEPSRALLLRTLASVARNDLRPLMRLARLTAGTDPETGAPLSPATESSAAYYAIGCQDYSADRDVGSRRLGDGYQRLVDDGERLAAIALDQLPCVTGFGGALDGSPVSTPPTANYPVLVMTATADPATPMAWAEAVFERMPNAHLIVTSDGGHGTFGWGLPCPDDIVKEFLAFGDLPEERRTECDGYLIEPYQPLPLGGPDAYPDVLEALVAVEETVASLPDYLYWDGAPRRLGCPQGGWMQMSWDANNDIFELHDCQVLADWPLNGTIELGADFTTTMDLQLPNGQLTYRSTEFWEVTVEGTIDGVPIDLEQDLS